MLKNDDRLEKGTTGRCSERLEQTSGDGRSYREAGVRILKDFELLELRQSEKLG